MSANNSSHTEELCKSHTSINVPYAHQVSFGLSQAVLCPFIIITNSLLIHVLRKTNQLNTVSRKLILVLNISDLLMGISGLISISVKLLVQKMFKSCIFETVIGWFMLFFGYFSFFIINCIAFDRYLKLTKQNRYSSLMTFFRMKCMILGCFLMATGLAVSFVVYPTFELQTVANCLDALELSFLITVYIILLRKLKRHSSTMKKRRAATLLTFSMTTSYTTGSRGSDATPAISRHQISAMKSIRLLILFIIIAFIPFNVVSFLWTYYKFGKKTDPGLVLNLMYYWSYFILMTNAGVNSIIILRGSSQSRRYIISMCSRTQVSDQRT